MSGSWEHMGRTFFNIPTHPPSHPGRSVPRTRELQKRSMNETVSQAGGSGAEGRGQQEEMQWKHSKTGKRRSSY